MKDLRYSTIATPESNVRVSTWTEPDGAQHHRMAVNGKVLSEGPLFDPEEELAVPCPYCGHHTLYRPEGWEPGSPVACANPMCDSNHPPRQEEDEGDPA